jgi:hypothetical protein
MTKTEEELLEALEDMVNQHCTTTNTKGEIPHLDSMALSANADAMRILAKHNKIVIESQYGRRIIARWKTYTLEEK